MKTEIRYVIFTYDEEMRHSPHLTKNHTLYAFVTDVCLPYSILYSHYYIPSQKIDISICTARIHPQVHSALAGIYESLLQS